MAYQALGTHFDQDLPAEAKREIEKYQQAYADAQAKGDRAGMDSAHAAAERIRANYGYSGGTDGSDYIGGTGQKAQTPEWNHTAERPTYTDPDTPRPEYGGYDTPMPEYNGNGTIRPEYVSQYGDQIDSVLNGILNREAFSYDYKNDPLYGIYSQVYQREGQRAMEDALGNAAAMSGGMASSAAMTAASQARDYYAAQQADIIPQLQQQAYSMYLQDLGNQRSDLANLMDVENQNYGKYRDQVTDWENDRNFGYGQWRDQVNDWRDARDFDYRVYRDEVSDWESDRAFGYGQYRDEVGDYYNDRNFSYGQHRDEVSDAQWRESMDYQRLQDALNRNDYAEAQDYERQLYRAELLAAAGDYSGYAALGFSDKEIARMQAAAQAQATAAASRGGGGGSSSSSSSSTVDDVESLFKAMKESGNPTTWLSMNYKKYGLAYNQLNAVLSDYNAWNSGQGSTMGSSSTSGGSALGGIYQGNSGSRGLHSALGGAYQNRGTFYQQAIRNNELDRLYQHVSQGATNTQQAWDMFVNAALEGGYTADEIQRFAQLR